MVAPPDPIRDGPGRQYSRQETHSATGCVPDAQLAARRWQAAPVGLALGISAALWLAARDLPFFSDDWQHLAKTARFPGWWTAFDPALEPFRPLQHLYFFALNALGVESPAAARAPLYALHALAAILLYRVSLGCGATPRIAFMAVGLFLLLPSAKVLSWPAAIGWPAHLCCVLLAILAVQRQLRQGGRITAPVTTACTVLAIGFHQSGILLPLVLALLLVSARGAPGLLQAVRAPWLLGPLAVAIAVVLLLLFGRDQPPPSAQGQAIAANAVKATLVFAPQALRLPLLDDLRAGGATAVPWLAGAGLAAAAGVWLWLAAAHGARCRWLCVAIAAELALPVATTGFVPRYGYVAAAFLALLLAAALTAAGQRRRLGAIAMALLAVAWGHDHVQDLRRLHATARTCDALLQQIERAVADLPPDRTLTVVDTLYVDGPEQDLLAFNYGLTEALRRRGAADRVACYRRQHGWFSSDLPMLDDAAFTALLQSAAPLLVYSPDARSYEPRRGDGR